MLCPYDGVLCSHQEWMLWACTYWDGKTLMTYVKWEGTLHSSMCSVIDQQNAAELTLPGSQKRLRELSSLLSLKILPLPRIKAQASLLEVEWPGVTEMRHPAKGLLDQPAPSQPGSWPQIRTAGSHHCELQKWLKITGVCFGGWTVTQPKLTDTRWDSFKGPSLARHLSDLSTHGDRTLLPHEARASIHAVSWSVLLGTSNDGNTDASCTMNVCSCVPWEVTILWAAS